MNRVKELSALVEGIKERMEKLKDLKSELKELRRREKINWSINLSNHLLQCEGMIASILKEFEGGK